MEQYKVLKLIEEAESCSADLFKKVDDIALYNQEKVLKAFINRRISYADFAPTTGYGYDDKGRTDLNSVFADVFSADDALVSPLIANGTHALTIALFGLLRPLDTLISVSGKPYDTLEQAIYGKNIGSLADYNVGYGEVDLDEDGKPDYIAIEDILKKKSPKVVFLQRSKGYLWREPLSISEIAMVIELIKRVSPQSIVVVDNCYGEFTDKIEPTDVGADIIVGSLIKNPGGGIAPTGGYIAGRKDLIEMISFRLTAPSLGVEVGSYSYGYRLFFQGLFVAPSTVKNTLKGNILTSNLLNMLGIESMPKAGNMPLDIINSVKFDTPEGLINFCKAVQAVSPIDSFVTPEPWDMPGYPHQVIMAAGTFVQGATLELSADGTIKDKPPYIAYLQGGLTYEHVKLALKKIVEKCF